jgi:hypothetical protein
VFVLGIHGCGEGRAGEEEDEGVRESHLAGLWCGFGELAFVCSAK